MYVMLLKLTDQVMKRNVKMILKTLMILLII
jgi:hypothetical protein